jgi:uncharacterized protein YqgQ
MPDYEKSIKKIRQENPDVADAKIEPASWFARLVTPNTVRATASPWTGDISYFPERIYNQGMGDDEVENLFTHELQHTRQTRGMGVLDKLRQLGRNMLGQEEPYRERPRELEAFQAEKDRTLRNRLSVREPYTGARDIQLPAMSARRKALDTFAQERKIRGLE